MPSRAAAVRSVLLALPFAALVACSSDATGPSEWGSGGNHGSGGGDDGGGSGGGDDGSSGGNGGNDGATPPGDGGGTGSDGGTPNDGFDAFQHHNLDVVNNYRTKGGIAALVLDKQLCAFALAGSQQESQDHVPHAHFNAAIQNGTLWNSGFTSTAGENQGDPHGWTILASDPTQNEMMQIDAILAAMYAEGPGPGEAHAHYMNIMNGKFHRLGAGLLEVSQHLYLTNDFSD
jgi:hypothetical protein